MTNLLQIATRAIERKDTGGEHAEEEALKRCGAGDGDCAKSKGIRRRRNKATSAAKRPTRRQRDGE